MNQNTFEYVFNNTTTYTSKSTKKRISRKILSKKNDRLFNNSNNNSNNNFKYLYNFYSKLDYEHITKLYEKLYNIIIDSKNDDQKKWNYTNGLLLYTVNYFLIYKLHEIILPGSFGIPYLVNKINKLIEL